MGFLSNLFGGNGKKTIDNNIYNGLLMLTKVGIAFANNGDGGFVSIIDNGNSLVFVSQCQTMFYYFLDNGCGKEFLVNKFNCPLEIWEQFERHTNMQIIREKDGGHEIKMESAIAVEKNTGKLYFEKLKQDLQGTYPEICIDDRDNNLSVILSYSEQGKYSYR